MAHRSTRFVASLVATAAVTLSVAVLGGAGAAQAAQPAGVRLVEPAVATPKGAHLLGAEPGTARLTFNVFLDPRDPAALGAYVNGVTDPHALTYGEYLTRGAFAARFGPTAGSAAAATAALRADGLSVSPTLIDGLGLKVSGSTATIERALSTTIERYRLANGTVGTAATRGISLPSVVANHVLAVVGLDNLVHPTGTSVKATSQIKWPTTKEPTNTGFATHPAGAPGAPGACSSAVHATEQGYGGITDDQVAAAYGVDGLYSAGDLGAGQTVAIYELEPFATSDIAAFDECYFGTNNTANLTVTNVDGGPGKGYGSGESVLDIENVSALAPKAHIDVYQAPNSTAGALDAYGAIVANDNAKVVSTSWGACESIMLQFSPGSLDVEHLLFEQAAAQGQTIFAAAGDSGADDCSEKGGEPVAPYLSVDDPASQPDVVSVGGTTAISVADPPTEQVWNDGAEGGASGGGSSRLWPMPSWQKRISSVVSQSSSSACGTGSSLCRVTPDVSAFADEYTGITIAYAGGWYTIGGTSSAAPIWAALLAEVNDSTTCRASSTTATGVGFASPLLYEVGANPTQNAQSYNDVTAGNNDIFSIGDGKYSAGVGYDAASGWGSPNLDGAGGTGLASTLCTDARAAATSAVTAVAPHSGTVAGGTAVTITGTGFKTGSTVNVAGVTFGDFPAASYTVVSATEITATTAPAGVPKLFGHTVLAGTEGLVQVTYTSGHVATGPTFSYVQPKSGALVPTVLSVGPSGGPTNGGNTVSVYGTGFTGATKVTFGNVAAKSFSIKSDSLIRAVVPKEGAAACLAGSHSSASGLCQTAVVVTNAAGKSTAVAPLKPYQGELNYNNQGVPYAPGNCHCELFPTITEYDFQAIPKITRIINESQEPHAPLSNPESGSFYTIDGTGFSWLTLDYLSFGDGSQQANQDESVSSIKTTAMQVYGNPDPNPSPSGNSVPVAAVSEGGASRTKLVAFGAVPKVTGVSATLLPSAGGTVVTLTGAGFSSSEDVQFYSIFGLPSTFVLGNFVVVSSSEIQLLSPSLVPGTYFISVDNPYGNSSLYTVPLPGGGPGASYETVPYTATNVTVTYPGGAALTGSANTSCSSAGGCTATLVGVNLGTQGDITVYVGTQAATILSDVTTGATSTLTVTVPPSFLGEVGAFAIILTTDNGQTPETLNAFETYA